MKKIFLASTLFLLTFALASCGSTAPSKQIVSTPDAPAAIGPYSQAVIYDGLVYTSGQIAIDPLTNQLIDGGIAEQTAQVFKNISAVLKAAKSELDKVIKCNVYLASMDDFAAMNTVYALYFKEGNYPARSACEVSNLPKGALVEIETIAYI